MDHLEFEKLLKEAGITKKRFAEMADLNYNSVVNWNQNKKGIPTWVRSWIENFIKAKLFENLAAKVKELEAKKE